jgi:hypothetical protein
MPDAEKLATPPSVAELEQVTRQVHEAWASIEAVMLPLRQVTGRAIGKPGERRETALTLETIGAVWSFAQMLSSYAIELREAAHRLTNDVDGFLLEFDAQRLERM